MKWKIAGINFDHFHMGDNLRCAFNHPRVEIVGLSDTQPQRMEQAAKNFGIPAGRLYTDYKRCLEETRPDIVILCPATAQHGQWTTRIAPFGVHIIMEKPFAATLAEADQMMAAMASTGKELLINWPLAWYPAHRTAKRLLEEGVIGDLLEFHHYGGNRGPLWHGADKTHLDADAVEREKPHSWFYKKSAGGGSLQDYLGYGTTLGTWYQGNRLPIEITAVVDEPPGLEVDEHCILVARYAHGLSKSETRWGTFTDPWTHQPQPRTGFILVGTRGTISCEDYAKTVRLQTLECPQGRDLPVDILRPEEQNVFNYFIHCLETKSPITGPVSLATSRIGQQMVDSAVWSAREKRTVPLLG